jgi:catalase
MKVPAALPKALAKPHSPSVLFDALVLPDGDKAVQALALDGHTMEYIKDQFRHCKSILALGASITLLEMAGILAYAGKDPGLLVAERNKAAAAAPAFITAITAHRHPSRDNDPPKV